MLESVAGLEKVGCGRRVVLDACGVDSGCGAVVDEVAGRSYQVGEPGLVELAVEAGVAAGSGAVVSVDQPAIGRQTSGGGPQVLIGDHGQSEPPEPRMRAGQACHVVIERCESVEEDAAPPAQAIGRRRDTAWIAG
ncbi:hypothetical protein [Streptomyces sp. NPDC058664]|uniref:hypothetical protein n=1 Tax=unclassified Streptomyces TaxID=2593676 RepID=UPI0036461191